MADEYLRFETELLELLTRHGWVARVERNRQDTMVTWTDAGRERATRFLDEVFALRPREQWSDAELAQLRRFGQYFGFVETTPRERLERRLEPALRSHNVLVVSTAPSGRRSYALFTARRFDGFWEHVERERDAGREVAVIAVEDVLDSDVGRLFATGDVLWQRGPGRTD